MLRIGNETKREEQEKGGGGFIAMGKLEKVRGQRE